MCVRRCHGSVRASFGDRTAGEWLEILSGRRQAFEHLQASCFSKVSSAISKGAVLRSIGKCCVGSTPRHMHRENHRLSNEGVMRT